MTVRRVLAGILALGASLPAAAAAQTPSHWGTYIGGSSPFTEVSPFPFTELGETVAVQASNSSSYALEANGTVFAWGDGNRGQLGNGAFKDSPETAVQVQLPVGVKAVALGEAKNEAAAVDSSGHVFVWGGNAGSALCVRGAAIGTPVKVPGLSGVVAASGGNEHMMFLTGEGTVLVCGSNAVGALGVGERVLDEPTPTLVPGLTHIVQISSGAGYSAARNSSGEIFMWGKNEHSHIGIGSSEPVIWTPVHVVLPEPAISVSAGGDNNNGATLALTASNAVYSWGDGAEGVMGNGSNEEQPLPINTGLHFAQIATGGEDSFGITSSGELFAWGWNIGGDLGIGMGGGAAKSPVFVASGVSSISATAETSISLSR